MSQGKRMGGMIKGSMSIGVSLKPHTPTQKELESLAKTRDYVFNNYLARIQKANTKELEDLKTLLLNLSFPFGDDLLDELKHAWSMRNSELTMKG